MAAPDDDTCAETGFLVHVFHRHQGTGTVVYGVGRLASGGTFAFVDGRSQPAFFVRCSDLETARRACGGRAQVEATAMRTMDGETVARVFCPRAARLRLVAHELERAGVRTYEADLGHSRRYLIERGLLGPVRVRGRWRPGRGVSRVYVEPELAPAEWEPELTVLALDIETDAAASRVLAVSLVACGRVAGAAVEEVHVVGQADPADPAQAQCYASERDLLVCMAQRMRALDPDVLTGWNVADFDLPVLQRRFQAHGLPFNLGRSDDDSWYQEGKAWGGSRVVVYGRQVLDAMHLTRAAGARFPDYRLDTVARALLGRGKTLAGSDEEHVELIQQAYTGDRPAFCQYCLEDARLVRDILARNNSIKLSLRRSMLTGLPLDRAWGSVAAFDVLYIGGLRRRGMVAPSTGVDRAGPCSSPGGLVMAPRAGLFRNIFVFDFRSLYPSIIRTFNIDPLAHVQAVLRQRGPGDTEAAADLIVAPNGAAFVREPGILPQLLERFFASRQQARQADDHLASYAYKITMNSFYGVLATDACRFADGTLAGAITGFGHYILRWTTALLQDRNVGAVLYGDTDSLFVDLGLSDDAQVATSLTRGQDLCAWINEQLALHVREQYGLASHLVLEFEKYYRRFLLPPMRAGGERGRAKGYAGLRLDQTGEQVEVVGMEAVRHDWTDLAHQLQRDLLDLLFHDAPAHCLQERAAEWTDGVRSGRRDRDLVYRKRLRRSLSQYTASNPPHVVAARRLSRPGGMIEYVMTVEGPQPLGHVTARLDYEHYVAKQIMPIVRTLSQVCTLDLAAATGGPPDLFGPRA